MDVYTVVGKRKGTFTDQKSGEVISYAKLYVTLPFSEQTNTSSEGVMCQEVKVKPEICDTVKVNSKVNIFYNRYAHVEGVVPITQR